MPKKLEEEVVKWASQRNITGKKKENALASVRRLYHQKMYDPEEPVGVVAAQSLSEPATQMTMRTYHFAGTAGIQVTLGLPRMLELFDARREPRTPTMTVYLNKDITAVHDVKKIAENVKEVKLKDIVLSTVIDLTEVWIKCRLNVPKMEELGIEIEKLPKIVKIRSVEITVDGDSLMAKSKRDDLKNLHKMKFNLLDTHIKGIKGVSQVIVSKNEGDEWIISTLGSNLKKVYEIEGVDCSRTISNNIFEIYEVLGIEAARNAIINQTRYTMEEQGLGVDIRYVMLLADLMTVDGLIRAIGRYGISGKKASILVRASFEETKKHITAAAIEGESDELRGTIENIMMNQVAPIGTGAFDLIGRIPEVQEEEKATKPAAKKAAKPAKPAKKAEPKEKKAPKKAKITKEEGK
jgi:DNA-directed RNA polymerase subunit A"